MIKVYEIYHDESKKGGYWHAFLFVPKENKDKIIKYLLNTKKAINENARDISFKDIKTRHERHHSKPKIARHWISYGVAIIQQQKKGKFPPAYYCVENGISKLKELLGAKLVVLRIDDSHEDMFEHMEDLSRIETTIRIGIKGGLHGLFFNNEQVQVSQIFIDGDEHYEGLYGRTLNKNRIIGKLSNEIKANISFAEDCEIIPIAKNNFDPNHPDRILVQLTDLMLGAIRFMNQENNKKHVRYWVADSTSTLLDREQSNFKRMKESRFFRGFLISGAKIDDTGWKFYPLKNKEEDCTSKQMSLLF